ncbi:hypothetical protein N7478_013305 [Penicillium angulare]|uniref:uncharacterized protein n=1 Tax=Penicillium angulare TaxID=116970 RepID=UPI00254079CE|nr:uncharacterized protein N7478_013305 [Penicillium angulare]KAJ5257201.1 hypothetical protein N7478_013305 [Penicillium angulare]
MRRAFVQTFRTARRLPVWKVAGKRPSPLYFNQNQVRSLRQYSGGRHSSFLQARSQSSMYFRNFGLAAISTVVASGAWYAYQGDGSAQSLATQVRAFASSAIASAHAEGPPDSTRRGLLVSNDQFYTATLSQDQPLTKETDDSDRRMLNMLTPEQATEKLRKNEESYLVNRGKGVVRYDIVQVPSNSPIEDDHAELIVEVPASVAANQNGEPSSDWSFWGVFDGHSGWTTSAKLRNVLISYVARELNATYKSAAADPSVLIPSSEAIDSAIKQGFLRLDHDIVNESVNKVLKSKSRRMAAELLAPALSGSCALLSFYDSQSQSLKVAVAGDSRAVLGRRGPSGKWTAKALSEDLTGGTPSEIKRLQEEHPGEPYVTRNGRILGNLEPSRAFGDAVYKWTKDVQDKIKGQFFGRTPSPLLKTPPYVTAEPVVTTTKIDPSKGDFVVMATDGLWEMLSNEEVVGLASDAQSANSNMISPPAESRFVVEDKNAATHLVRNAMGGKDKEMITALLTLPAPYSRRYRDDITVEVIFFGQGPDSRTVERNEEACAPEETPKAKL